ncbi:MAG: DNA polymerase III subunit gamma/tau [Clostridiales bacterium]|nr:DNA polymerase III subunit gamma/tau [Clostridiales bacterium]
MSYTALYRKWRPDEFEEVKGQGHIVTTLKNQITHDRIGHAYLFCGTRGTGKTTIARLFAKAVNCEHPLEDGSPCNECPTCKAISAGTALNVIEIDAASNNGVDSIREIRDGVQYSPTEGKYKVYIIDEVHNLSGAAFNAMLKTLEEPPSYVIFILATTESHKIPITISSRCQRYDFRRIDLETIYERLAELLKREGIEAEEKAVRYIAKAGDGSMRDALSLLDQCIAFYLGQTLTYDKVLEMLGTVDVEVFNTLMNHITENDTLAALKIVEKVVWEGRELSQFVTDFTWYMRNLLLLKSSDDVNDQLDISSENIESMKLTADKVTMNQLMRYIRIFSGLSNEIRYATQKRVTLEIAVIKLTTPQMEQDMDSILDRIRVLEEKVEKGVMSLSEEQLAMIAANGNITGGTAQNAVADMEETVDIDREAVLKRELQPAEYEDMKAIMQSIEEIKSNPEYRLKVGHGTLNLLQYASINIGHDRKSLLLTFDNSQQGSMGYDQFMKEEHRTALQEMIGELTGKQVDITCQSKESLKETNLGNINLSKVKFDIKIEN